MARHHEIGREATCGLSLSHKHKSNAIGAQDMHYYFNVIIMKKFLLPLMSLMFFATSTNAQNLNRKAVKAEVPAQVSLALDQPAQKGGVKKLADN